MTWQQVKEDSWQDLQECKAHRGSDSRNAFMCEKHSCTTDLVISIFLMAALIQNTITSTFLHMQLVWFWVDRLSSKTRVQLVMITSTTICQKKSKKKKKKICSFKVPTTHSHFILSIVLISAVSASTQKPPTMFSAVVLVLKSQPQCSLCCQCQYSKANHNVLCVVSTST